MCLGALEGPLAAPAPRLVFSLSAGRLGWSTRGEREEGGVRLEVSMFWFGITRTDAHVRHDVYRNLHNPCNIKKAELTYILVSDYIHTGLKLINFQCCKDYAKLPVRKFTPGIEPGCIHSIGQRLDPLSYTLEQNVQVS